MNLRSSLFTLLAALTVSIFMVSCGDDASSSDVSEARQDVSASTPDQASTMSTSSFGNSDAQNATNKTPAQPAKPVGPLTSMDFSETTFDFGDVPAGEKVRHTYKFKNSGNEPLLISNVKPACGCTAPSYTETPVAPGEMGEVTLEFTANKGGKGGKTSKSATITANTSPATTQIRFTANVIPTSN